MKDAAKSVGIEEEVKRSYLDYAMSVIIGRALPDVRDGLKPVHRRILFSMYEMGNTYNKPHKKSARVVGDVIGKYHPHGDAAVYDALVRMAQDFSMRYPLIDGHGNFGSMDGDPPAAMRYTEVRMSKIATLFMEDIDKETVDFRPNYDGSSQEPEVLPTPFPNLLMNGSSGIAVGMATSIPPHNLSELVDALLLVLERRDVTVEEIMKVLPGPDFPTGGIIVGREGIRKAYTTGRGSVVIRSKIEEEEGKIIVREIPYMVNKSQLLERIALLANEKKIEGISAIRDESDREGIRVVIELKRGVQRSVIMNRLLKMTPLETSFNIILLGISKGQPKIFSIKELLEEFLDFRTEIVTRRTEFILRKSKERLHILEGLKIALDNIDRVIEIIKASKTPKDAKEALMGEFSLSEVQAQAILDMRLQRLTALEKDKIVQEYKETQKKVEECLEILSSKEKLLGIVRDELRKIKDEFGDDRKTAIEEIREDISIEDLIPVEEMLVTVTERGYIKRTPIREYRAQRRGGKGKRGMQVSESDLVSTIFHAYTHDWLLIFTSKGKVHWLKVYEIPQSSLSGKGKNIINLIPVDKDEKVSSLFSTRDLGKDMRILFATKLGVVKKTHLSDFSRPRRGGITAITLKEGDELVQTLPIYGGERIFMATRYGMVNVFPEDEVRTMGRLAYGVRGIRLSGGDEVVGVGTIEEGEWIIFVTENGYAKKVEESEFRKTHRGSMGVKGIKLDEKSGLLSKALRSRGTESLVVIADSGKSIRIRVKEIPSMKRFSRGVKVMDLQPKERVASATLIEKERDES